MTRKFTRMYRCPCCERYVAARRVEYKSREGQRTEDWKKLSDEMELIILHDPWTFTCLECGREQKKDLIKSSQELENAL